jgi:hypothetical protein
MSIYKFFESYVEENPELISVKAANSLHYENLYNMFMLKVIKLSIKFNYLE